MTLRIPPTVPVLAPPALAPELCDASGMVEIHRMYRAGFGETPALVASVAEGDAAHADAVGNHLSMLSISLHAHHEFEDDHLWDTLDQRAPKCVLRVARMKEQHVEMLVHLTELDSALPRWRGSGSSADAAAVTAALAGINAALAVHLPDEEEHIVPVMEQVLSQREIDAASEHGRQATPKGKTLAQLGAILAAPDRASRPRPAWLEHRAHRLCEWPGPGHHGAHDSSSCG